MQPLRLKAVGTRSDGRGTTPLFAACEHGHLDTVHLLLSRGASPNRTLELGSTALHAAAARGNAPLVRLLLQFGANVNAAKEDGTR